MPKQPIKVYGPGTVSGTRDAFTEMVMEKSCERYTEFAKAYPDEKDRKKVCRAIREDGKYVESGEDYNIIIQKLVSDEQALGIFGYSFYGQNLSKIQSNKIDGVEPNADTIISGKYGISRGLYVYVKKENIAKVPGIVEFIKELTSDDAIGPEGYVAAKGLIPLKNADRVVTRDVVAKLSVK